VLAAIPGVPTITVRPDVVFLVFLPPLLYSGELDEIEQETRREGGLRDLWSPACAPWS
jgi:hypothetical protein